MLSKIQYLIHFSAVVIGTLMSREKLIPKITAYHTDSILWECSDFFHPLSSLLFLQKASENMILSVKM